MYTSATKYYPILLFTTPFNFVYIPHVCPLELRQLFSSFVFFGL